MQLSVTGHVLSFETPVVALQKAHYIMNDGIGGMAWWSVDQDWTKLQRDTSGRSGRAPHPKGGKADKGGYERPKGAKINDSRSSDEGWARARPLFASSRDCLGPKRCAGG